MARDLVLPTHALKFDMGYTEYLTFKEKATEPFLFLYNNPHTSWNGIHKLPNIAIYKSYNESVSHYHHYDQWIFLPPLYKCCCLENAIQVMLFRRFARMLLWSCLAVKFTRWLFFCQRPRLLRSYVWLWVCECLCWWGTSESITNREQTSTERTKSVQYL